MVPKLTHDTASFLQQCQLCTWKGQRNRWHIWVHTWGKKSPQNVRERWWAQTTVYMAISSWRTASALQSVALVLPSSLDSPQLIMPQETHCNTKFEKLWIKLYHKWVLGEVADVTCAHLPPEGAYYMAESVLCTHIQWASKIHYVLQLLTYANITNCSVFLGRYRVGQAIERKGKIGL